VARLPLVDPEDGSADERAREILGAIRAGAGRDFNVFRAVANHPALLESLASFTATAYYLNSLRPDHRELAYLSASVVNECHY
jgi:alkylhydroperoxidase family enzyme